MNIPRQKPAGPNGSIADGSGSIPKRAERRPFPPRIQIFRSRGKAVEKQGAAERREQHDAKIALISTPFSLPVLSWRCHIVCCCYELALPSRFREKPDDFQFEENEHPAPEARRPERKRRRRRQLYIEKELNAGRAPPRLQIFRSCGKLRRQSTDCPSRSVNPLCRRIFAAAPCQIADGFVSHFS